MSLKHNIDIVVISCDSYSDVWPYFFKYFFYYWNECPLDLYLISNKKTFDSKKINNISIGPDFSWSDNLSNGLKIIDKDYILLMIDDLILDKRVSNSYFNKLSSWINIKNPDYLRLHNSNKPIKHDNLVGKIPLRSPYKTSTMPCIWKKSALLKVLKEGESAWEFEINGSKRAYSLDGFYSVYDNLIEYNNSIIKGKWQRSFAFKINLKEYSRPIMNNFEQLVYDIRKIRSKIFNLFPNFLRLILKG